MKIMPNLRVPDKHGHMATLAFGLLLMVLPLATAATPEADEDAALFAACPGLSDWAQTHPRGQNLDVPGATQAPPASSELAAELARRAALDQGARAFLSVGQAPDQEQLQQLVETDADNLVWLQALIAREGFPTVEKVGHQGVLNAWLLVQHADADSALQEAVLDQLMASGSDTGLGKANVAMLSDRVRLAQGKPQRYGTQFVPNENGDPVLQEPVENLAGIDARRAQAGLMPLELYRCVLQETYQ